MSFQDFTIATAAVRNSGGIVARLADQLGVLALIVMGLAMGGVTAFAGA